MKKNRIYILWIGIIVFLFTGYFIIDNILFDGFKPRIINENGFQANYYEKINSEKKVAIILIGGGQWGDYWGQEFAKKGYIGLSLHYTGKEGLPKSLEEIKLEYFENALKWMKKQQEVNPYSIIVMGASRNAELSLIIASTFPELVNGVIAYSPSSVSWSNTVQTYSSNELRPSWKYKGKDIPYVPMDKILGNNSKKIETLKYWENGLANSEYVTKATIEVNKIKGPILLFSGIDDKVWPSSVMADMIEQRLKESNFLHPFQNVKYEKAGHLISSHPEKNTDIRTGTLNIDGKVYEFEYGGTKEGDKMAKQDAKIRIMEFIKKI